MLLARKEVNTTQSFVCKPIKMMNQSSSNEIVLPKKLYRLYNLFMYLLAESLSKSTLITIDDETRFK
jgi:hypothetical protein